jgi:hypothetical protein
MAENETAITFGARDFRGSRFRCLLATSLSQPNVVRFLNSMVQPQAEVGEEDRYMPEGLCRPDEAKLGETSGFLTDGQHEEVTGWWLAVRERANTPNWDIVSTCTIEGRKGLILVEAKAHSGELNPNDRCGAGNDQNRAKIAAAIAAANTALNGAGWAWSLSSERFYQLSNRFAWAWKVASLGVPVILVYLGFLNAAEMSQPFASHEAWEQCLLAYADGCVPRQTWFSGSIQVSSPGGSTPLTPLIRSADVNIRAS